VAPDGGGLEGNINAFGSDADFNIGFGSGVAGTLQADGLQCNGDTGLVCQITPVPEAPTMAIFIGGIALAGAVGLRRRRSRLEQTRQ